MLEPDPQRRFSDSPWAKIRLVWSPPQARSLLRIFSRSAVATLYILAATVLSIAVASYGSLGGSRLLGYIPDEAVLSIHVPDGNALRLALEELPALREIADDSDFGRMLEVRSQRTEASEQASEDSGERETPRHRIAALLGRARERVWPLGWMLPSTFAGWNAYAGDEVAFCVLPAALPESGAEAKIPALILTRVSGSRGHLLRMALPFLNSRDAEWFDLGGGLIGAGLHGARPAGMQSVPRRIEPGALGSLELSLSETLAAQPPRTLSDSDRQALDALGEAGVPESVLRALAQPPAWGEVLNLVPPFAHSPVRLSLALRRSPTGGFSALGRVEGYVPPLPAPPVSVGSRPKIENVARVPVAEFVLPVDMRAAFLRYLDDTMKFTGEPGLNKNQRRWLARFRILEHDEEDLDKDLWPAIGHVADIRILEPHADESASGLGTIQAWLPFIPRDADSFFAVAELARVRWDFLFDDDSPATVKPPFVRRFRPKHYDTARLDEYDERYTLANGQVSVPAWSVSRRGLRITSDAGLFSRDTGPDEAALPQPPERLDRYRVRFDGGRLAPRFQALVSSHFDDLAEELGPQKFLAKYPDRASDIRAAGKLAQFAGLFELEVIPDARGAEVTVRWELGRSVAEAAPRPGTAPIMVPKDDNDVPAPPPLKEKVR